LGPPARPGLRLPTGSACRQEQISRRVTWGSAAMRRRYDLDPITTFPESGRANLRYAAPAPRSLQLDRASRGSRESRHDRYRTRSRACRADRPSNARASRPQGLQAKILGRPRQLLSRGSERRAPPPRARRAAVGDEPEELERASCDNARSPRDTATAAARQPRPKGSSAASATRSGRRRVGREAERGAQGGLVGVRQRVEVAKHRPATSLVQPAIRQFHPVRSGEWRLENSGMPVRISQQCGIARSRLAAVTNTAAATEGVRGAGRPDSRATGTAPELVGARLTPISPSRLDRPGAGP